MTFSEIMAIIVAAAPSITAIVGIIFAVIKGIRSNKDVGKELKDEFLTMKEEVLKTKEYSELKAQLAIAHEENLILKRKLNELLTKIDRIHRED